MNRILSQLFKDQYTSLYADLISSWAINKQNINQYIPQIKTIHKKQLSLSCVATIIGHRSRRNEYSKGISETSYLSLVMGIKGLENPACVLLRQTIELTLKHIYFSTHPVEYGWACTRVGYKDLTFQKLLEFIRRTDEYHNYSQGCNFCDIVENLFGYLSRHVHVHSRYFMGYNKIVSAHQTNETIINKLNTTTKELWPILISFLIIFFPEKYNHASAIDKKLIRNALTKKQTTLLDTYFRNYVPA